MLHGDGTRPGRIFQHLQGSVARRGLEQQLLTLLALK